MKKPKKTVPRIKERTKFAIRGRRINLLEAAIKLINANLKTIRRREFGDLVRVIQDTFGGLADAARGYEFGVSELSILREQHARLYRFQTVLGNFFNKMMATMSQQKDDDELPRLIEEELDQAPPIASSSVTLNIAVSLEYVPDSADAKSDPRRAKYGKSEPEWLTENLVGYQIMNQWPLGPTDKYALRIQTSAATQEEKLLYDFVMALDDLPLAALRTCEECGKWFLHTTNKKRLFCSSQCRARRGSRESYRKIKASDPGKYEEAKKGARERAKSSYQKKAGLDKKPRKSKPKED